MTCTKKMFTGLMSVFTLMGAAQAALITIDGSTPNTETRATAVFELQGIHNWTADNEYLLKGTILVGNGAVLNIEAGTVIRGANEVTTKAAYNVDYRPGSLIVERGGKIFANGTAENPIVMTDEWDNHFPWKNQWGSSVTRTWMYRNGSNVPTTHNNQTYDYGKIGNLHGAWGGLVLCGKAFVNWDGADVADLGTVTINVEGVDSGLGIAGGGNDDDDSSGVVKYVQIRYGGAITTQDGKEINGLTLYGVGRGTELHHIEVYNNQDDGIEWFGGTVNAKHLVVWGAGDDTFDSDAGFRGKNQFLFGVQRNLSGSKIESGCSDKGMEMDGFEKTAASGSMLFSASLWANITLIGADYVDSTKRNAAISMRDNASPQIYNSVFMDFGSKATFIENRTDITANGITLNVADRFETPNTLDQLPTWRANNAFGQNVGPEYFYQAQVPGNQACLRGSVFWNIQSGLYLTNAGPTSLMTAYPWINAKAGGGPNVSGSLALYSDWDMEQEGNVVGLYNLSAGDTADADADNLMPIKRRYRTQVVKGPSMTSAAYDITEIDPRAANDAVTGAMYIPDSWVTPTAYRGAFGPSNNWAKGWTTIATLGAFGEAAKTDPQEVEPLVDNTVYVTNTIVTVVTNGVNGIVYQDNGTAFTGEPLSTDVAVWGIQTSPVVTYTIATAGTYQLQYTASLNPGEVNWQPVKTFTATAVPVTVNLTDLVGFTPEHSDDSRFYRLMKQ